MIRVAGAGWLTLLYKELLRFWKATFQTILAPVITSLLYLLIFSHVLESRVSVFAGEVSYTAFLVPGLVMMSVLQNAFANSSSSMIQSKITGNLIFILLPPLSPADFFLAYVLGAMIRGLTEAGLAKPDPHRLGLAVESSGQILGAAGQPSPGLYAIGPLCQGTLWEITAVPEIVRQADRAAQAIAASAAPTEPALEIAAS